MSYFVREYGCDECGGTFEVLQHRDEGPPDECKLCGFEFATPKLPTPSSFRITTAAQKATDKVVDQYFDATAAAAAEAGNPALKVTNMRDNVRQGETYAMPDTPRPSQEYQQIMAGGMAPMFGGQGQAVGGMQSQDSVRALAAQGREAGMSMTGAPTVRGFAASPSAPHKRLTGRFNRQDATGQL